MEINEAKYRPELSFSEPIEVLERRGGWANPTLRQLFQGAHAIRERDATLRNVSPRRTFPHSYSSSDPTT
jgi:hypothetical protein